MNNLIHELRKAGYKIRVHVAENTITCGSCTIKYDYTTTLLVNKKPVQRGNIVEYLQTQCVEMKQLV